MKINEKAQKIVSLEQAITEGTKALIPYEFEYPNSDLTVEVKLKPITSKEAQHIGQIVKLDPETTFDLELLKIALFNVDESSFETEILEKLPMGVVLDLSYKICDISGIDLETQKKQEQPINELAGF